MRILIAIIQFIETSEKSPVFVTRFESSSDGIKSTTSKIADVEGVLIEEVLSEPEQEKESAPQDVTIEEVFEGKKYRCNKNYIFFLFK